MPGSRTRHGAAGGQHGRDIQRSATSCASGRLVHVDGADRPMGGGGSAEADLREFREPPSHSVTYVTVEREQRRGGFARSGLHGAMVAYGCRVGLWLPTVPTASTAVIPTILTIRPMVRRVANPWTGAHPGVGPGPLRRRRGPALQPTDRHLPRPLPYRPYGTARPRRRPADRHVTGTQLVQSMAAGEPRSSGDQWAATARSTNNATGVTKRARRDEEWGRRGRSPSGQPAGRRSQSGSGDYARPTATSTANRRTAIRSATAAEAGATHSSRRGHARFGRAHQSATRIRSGTVRGIVDGGCSAGGERTGGGGGGRRR